MTKSIILISLALTRFNFSEAQQFALSDDPVKDAKIAFAESRQCYNKYYDESQVVMAEFFKSIDNYQFKNRYEARRKILESLSPLEKNADSCDALKQKYFEALNINGKTEEYRHKFNSKYIAELEENKKVHRGFFLLNKKLIEKIKELPKSAEEIADDEEIMRKAALEKVRQDSIFIADSLNRIEELRKK